jgi:hypothetical protein
MNFFENAVFVSEQTNDLVTALCALGYHPRLASDAMGGVDMLSENGALFLLANDYPRSGTALTEELLAQAREKHVKIYVEYPESILGAQTEEPRGILYERIVITGALGHLEKDAILTLNGCKYRRALGRERAIIALAKVAGYDTLEYGMPEEWETMLGYLDEREDVLVATTALTNFITARHAPKIRWRALWQGILSLMGAGDIPFDYEESVTIVAGKEQTLAEDAADEAIRRNIQWITGYMIDHSIGVPRVVEGFGSAMDENGNQQPRMVFRGDCTGEIAMTIGQAAKKLRDESLAALADGIIDRFFTPDVFYNDDPRSSAYGHTNWFENGKIFYGDDNARALLGVISARAISGETRWDDKILRVVFANLRTSDKFGVRVPRIDIDNFKDKTWLDFYNGTVDYISPHYQASLYALFLWAYQLTGIQELLDKSVSAIEKTMALFPHKLRWQNGLTGEITRMLLPLSILVRIDPSEKHVKWLRDAVDAASNDAESADKAKAAARKAVKGKLDPSTLLPEHSEKAPSKGDAAKPREGVFGGEEKIDTSIL